MVGWDVQLSCINLLTLLTLNYRIKVNSKQKGFRLKIKVEVYVYMKKRKATEEIISEIFELHTITHGNIRGSELRIRDNFFEYKVNRLQKKYKFYDRQVFLGEVAIIIQHTINQNRKYIQIFKEDRTFFYNIMVGLLDIKLPDALSVGVKKEYSGNRESKVDRLSLINSSFEMVVLFNETELVQEMELLGINKDKHFADSESNVYIKWFNENKASFLNPLQLKFLEVAPQYLKINPNGSISFDIKAQVESGHTYTMNRTLKILNRIRKTTMKHLEGYELERLAQQEIENITEIITLETEIMYLYSTFEMEEFQKAIKQNVLVDGFEYLNGTEYFHPHIEEVFMEEVPIKYCKHIIKAIKYNNEIDIDTLDFLVSVLGKDRKSQIKQLKLKKAKLNREVHINNLTKDVSESNTYKIDTFGNKIPVERFEEYGRYHY